MVYYSDEDDIATANQIILNPGDNFHVYTGLRHQMVALEDSELTDQLLDMLLSKKRSQDRRKWLEEKGNLAEV